MKRLRISVSGRVQGVFFRASARREARRLGLTGFAHNEPDGSVLIEVQGGEEPLEEYLAWVHEGPASAIVEKVKEAGIVTREGEREFEIR